MPQFRVIPEEEAKGFLRRTDFTVYIEELKRHPPEEWVVAELSADENKDQVKRQLKRAADYLKITLEFRRSPSNTVLFQTFAP